MITANFEVVEVSEDTGEESCSSYVTLPLYLCLSVSVCLSVCL